MAPKKKGRGRGRVDMDKMRKDRTRSDRRGQGAELWKMEEGEHLLYICPPVHEVDPMVYVECQVHYGVGPNNRMVVNLEDLVDMDPLIEAFEKRENFSMDDAIEGWDYMLEYSEDSGIDRIQIKPRWLFNVVPLQHRRSKRHDWQPGKGDPVVLMCGKTIYDGITDLFFDEGDISDPDAAILVKIAKKGSGLGTEYNVTADTTTLKKPLELDEELWDTIEEYLQPGKDGDLYALLARFCRTKAQIDDIIHGRESDDDDDDDDEEREEKRRSTKIRTASSRRRSKKKTESEEAPKAKPKRRKSRKADPEPEEPEEPEDDDLEEEEEEDDSAALEAALKKRTRRRRKKD